MKHALPALTMVIALTASAWADEAPEPVASSPWAAIAMFAVVIGMIAGVIIWRRRR
jgi:hypothetical protein